jgi:hypothetical protein
MKLSFPLGVLCNMKHLSGFHMYAVHEPDLPCLKVRTTFPSTLQLMLASFHSIPYLCTPEMFPSLGTSSTELKTPYMGEESSAVGAKILVCQWEGSPPKISTSISSLMAPLAGFERDESSHEYRAEQRE